MSLMFAIVACFVFRAEPELGKLSEKYESGDRGPGTVSTGVGDPGGVSYGSYQLASKVGRAAQFVAKYYPEEFRGLEAGTPAFTARWKKLAAADPKALHAAEHEFIKVTHYDPQVNKLRAELKLDAASRSRALRDVIWSTAVHHGPNTDVIAKAVKPLIQNGELPGDAAIIQAVYAERGRTNADGTLARFRRVSGSWVPALKKRFVSEQADALAMLAGEK